jgi:tRNA modification GTPase
MLASLPCSIVSQGRDIAITSEIAGTTRDVLEVRVDLDGLPVTFLDTAGLRDSDDAIEQIGVARARERAAAADLRVLLEDGLDPTHGLIAGVAIDFLSMRPRATSQARGISAFTGEGIDRLLADVSAALAERVSDTAIASHERHRQAMMRAQTSLLRRIVCFTRASKVPRSLPCICAMGRARLTR